MAFSVSMGYGDRMTWRLALNKTPRHFKPLHHQTLSDGLRGESHNDHRRSGESSDIINQEAQIRIQLSLWL